MAIEQRGLVTRRQCHAAGLTDAAIEWRLSRGWWLRVHPGVYLTTPGRDDWWMRAVAAHLACGVDAAWSHQTAGYAHGLVTRPPPLVELIVPHRATVAAPAGAIVRPARRLDARSRHPRRELLNLVLGDVAEGAESAMEVR